MFSDGKKGTAWRSNEWYHKYAPTEMKDTKLLLRPSFTIPARCTARRRSWFPTISRASKCAPPQSHHRRNGEDVRRHQRGRLRRRKSRRRDRAWRRRRDHLPPGGRYSCFGIDKVVKYHMDVPLYTTVFTYNMNLARYNSMSDRAEEGSSTITARRNGPPGSPIPGPSSKPMGRVKMKALPEPRGLRADRGPNLLCGRTPSSRCTTVGPPAVTKARPATPPRSTPICRRRLEEIWSGAVGRLSACQRVRHARPKARKRVFRARCAGIHVFNCGAQNKRRGWPGTSRGHDDNCRRYGPFHDRHPPKSPAKASSPARPAPGCAKNVMDRFIDFDRMDRGVLLSASSRSNNLLPRY